MRGLVGRLRGVVGEVRALKAQRRRFNETLPVLGLMALKGSPVTHFHSPLPRASAMTRSRKRSWHSSHSNARPQTPQASTKARMKLSGPMASEVFVITGLPWYLRKRMSMFSPNWGPSGCVSSMGIPFASSRNSHALPLMPGWQRRSALIQYERASATSGMSRRTPTAKSCGPNLSGLPVIVMPAAPTKLAREPVYLVAAGRMVSIESQAPDSSRSFMPLIEAPSSLRSISG